MVPRYHDCESCAFSSEPAMCDCCSEANQWESAEPMEFVLKRDKSPTKNLKKDRKKHED